MAVSMNSTPPTPIDVLDRVRTIVRRDLKLPPDAAIPEDMPFFGGEFDLDSLDLLLLLTSIEKEFGLKIPNEAVGQTVFQNVTTLVRYVQEHAGRTCAGTVAASATGVKSDPLTLLPHGEPFRFVSRLERLQEGVDASGVWSVSGQEAFFAGHFPKRPLVPGVLLAEALAQLSGLIGPHTDGEVAWTEGKLAHVDIRFERAVSPPAEIVLYSRLAGAIGPLQLFEVSASLGSQTLARGTLSLKREPGGAS